ncbi:MFS transporter [bacterium]|nr:MFS transporter [bacterium]
MKNLRALFFLFAANTVSGFAQGITMLAIPWYMVSELGEANGKLQLTLIVAAITVLSLFWGLYAGTLIDKYNRKYIFLGLNGIDFLILVTAGFLGMYFKDGSPNILIGIMAGVYCVTVFTYNVHYPNLYAFVQELFEPRFYEKVNSAVELQGQFTNALGMFCGGVLLVGSQQIGDWWPEAWAFESWELYEIFWLDGSTYLLSVFLLSMIPYKRAAGAKIDKGPVLQRLKQGFDYLLKKKPLLIFGICAHLIFFALLVIIQVVLAIYVSDYLKGDAYDMARFKGMYAIGAVFAGFIGLFFLSRKNDPIIQVIVLLGIAGLSFITMAVTQSVVFTLGIAFLIGICNAGARIIRITYIIRIVPNRVVGRVNSFFMVVNVAIRFLFLLILTLPFFSGKENGENIVWALGLLGIICFAGGLILILRFKSFERTPELININVES